MSPWPFLATKIEASASGTLVPAEIITRPITACNEKRRLMYSICIHIYTYTHISAAVWGGSTLWG